MSMSPSPFRYAGGKSWLAPRVAGWCRDIGARTIIEPFAGGASTAIHCILSGAVEHAVLAEADPGMLSLWRVLVEGSGAEYGSMLYTIMHLEPSRASVAAFLDGSDGGRHMDAARTLVRNRTAYGGGLKAGMLGESDLQKRWNPFGWGQRMKAIRQRQDAFTVHGPDGLACIAAHAGDRHALLFLDPPYSAAPDAAGHGLYRHASLDHQAMLRAACSARGALAITYDDSPTTREMAVQHGLYCEPLPMIDGRGRRRNELLIARDAQYCSNC